MNAEQVRVQSILLADQWETTKKSLYDLKMILLVCKALRGHAPASLSDMLAKFGPRRLLRSSGTSLLFIPKCNGEAALSFYASCLTYHFSLAFDDNVLWLSLNFHFTFFLFSKMCSLYLINFTVCIISLLTYCLYLYCLIVNLWVTCKALWI